MKQWKTSMLACTIAWAFTQTSLCLADTFTPPDRPTCEQGATNCINYDGTNSSAIKTLYIALSYNNKPVYSSIGFSAVRYPYDSYQNNTILVTSGKSISGVIRGAVNDTQSVTGNLVYIDLSQATGTDANLLQSDSIWSNSEFDDAGGFIAGGTSVQKTVQNNRVYIKGTYDPSDESSMQKGKISGGVLTGAATYGTQATELFELSNNQIWLENVYLVAPTESGVSDATSRTSVMQDIFGVRLQNAPRSSKGQEFGADFINNTVSIQNSNVWVNRIAAGFAQTVTNARDWATVTTTSGYASKGNQVLIDNSTIHVHSFLTENYTGIMAGYAFYREASANTLTIHQSTLNVSSDNSLPMYLTSVGNQAGPATNNTVLLDDTRINYTKGSNGIDRALQLSAVVAYMGASGNTLSITGASSIEGISAIFSVKACGTADYQYTDNALTISGDASQNKVTTLQANNGDVTTVYTNAATLNNVTFSNNSLTIDQAAIEGTHHFASVYITQGQSVKAASDNQVSIANTKVDAGQSLYGVYSTVGGTYENNVLKIGSNVTASDGGIASFERVAPVYLDGLQEGATLTLNGNTLEVGSPILVKKLSGFNHLIFNLEGYQDTTRPYIQITDANNPVLVVEATDGIEGTVTAEGSSISIVGTGDAINALNDPIVLIASQGGFIDETRSALKEGDYTHLLTQGATIQTVKSLARIESTAIDPSELHLMIEAMPTTASSPLARDASATHGQNLILKVGSDTSQPVPIPPAQTQVDENGAVTESALSGLNTQFLSDDLLVDSVLLAPTRLNDGLFAAARTGRYHVHSQARQIANTSNALLGYGQSVGQSTVGLFVETGYSSYDTTVATALGNVVGDGSSSYAGAGLLGLYPLGSTGLFLQGYVKAGYLSHHYDVTLSNVPVNFDRTTPYWSAQLGLSWDYQLTDRVQAKTFLNYYYDGQGSETFDLAGTSSVAGAHFELDAMNAHRLVLGQMWTYHYQDDLKPYVGLRIEEALKAKATGQARDSQGYVPLGDTDLEGTTGIVSMGYSYTPTNANYGVHMGANGYVGVRNGVSAQIEAHWRF